MISLSFILCLGGQVIVIICSKNRKPEKDGTQSTRAITSECDPPDWAIKTVQT